MRESRDDVMTWGERALNSEKSHKFLEMFQGSGARLRSIALWLGALAALLIIVPRVIHFIPAGHGGVLWRRLGSGTVHQRAIGEGITFTFPWDTLTIFDLRVIDFPLKYSALSNDGLPVTVALTLSYRVSPAELSYLFQDVGQDFQKKLIEPLMGSIVLETISRYRADELYAFGRQRLQHEVKDAVMDRLEYGHGTGVPRGDPDVKDGFVTVSALSVLDIGLPATVIKAIESKMEQDQIAQEYEFRLRRETMEAKRKELEVDGIDNYKRVATAAWFRDYLKMIEIQANYDMAKSPNAKLVFLGQGQMPPLHMPAPAP
jgi:prohibitin 2